MANLPLEAEKMLHSTALFFRENTNLINILQPGQCEIAYVKLQLHGNLLFLLTLTFHHLIGFPNTSCCLQAAGWRGVSVSLSKMHV